MDGSPSSAAVEGGATAPPSAAVELRGVTKRFGSVLACDAVDVTVRRGEIHGLLGQNGAGKSTLMKILLGLYTADAGTILLSGKPVMVKDPLAAASMGIAMVHQHFSVIGALRVWENVTLGEKGRVDAKRAAGHVRDIAERYGLDVDPNARIEDLTTGQRQRVEIIKCLRRDPDILILDEPTSVLTLAESQELFAVLRRVVQEESRAVILISHKLDEILHATDRVTIMRDGAVVARHETAETDAAELAREMVGRDVSLRTAGAALGVVVDETGERARPRAATDVVLAVKDARVRGRDGRVLLDGCTFDVRRGEIFGLAGVEGNGQRELGQLLSSVLTLDEGTVEVEGRPVRAGRPGAMLRAGVGVIPEDRHESGCVLDMSVAENLVLADVDDVSNGIFVNRQALRERAEALIERFSIRTPSSDTPMRQLSGGNQQRVVLARELSRNPKVLVAAQPTHGLDVGAIEFVTEQLRAAAERGMGVLLISTELEEILAIADRVAVIAAGRIMGVMDRADVELERLGLMLGGRAA